MHKRGRVDFRSTEQAGYLTEPFPAAVLDYTGERDNSRRCENRHTRIFIMTILLIGTLDTKGIEIAFVRDQLQEAGLQVLVADAGILGPPSFPPDLPREELFAAAGFRVEELKRAADRGKGQDLTREIHLRHQVGVVDDRADRKRQRVRKEVPCEEA